MIKRKLIWYTDRLIDRLIGNRKCSSWQLNQFKRRGYND